MTAVTSIELKPSEDNRSKEDKLTNEEIEENTNDGNEKIKDTDTEKNVKKYDDEENNNNDDPIDLDDHSKESISNDDDGRKDENNDTHGKSKREAEKTGVQQQHIRKRARTAYFIFADDKRREFKENGIKHKSVAFQAREIGQLWSNIPINEKDEYKLLAANEKKLMVEQMKLSGEEVVSDKSKTGVDAYGLTIPNGKIRKLVKLDPEVKSISKEAMFLLTKSCELFTSKLALESNNVARIQNRRTVLLDDTVEICSSREQFIFLKEDIKDLKQELLDKKKAEKDSIAMKDGSLNKKGAIHQYFTNLP